MTAKDLAVGAGRLLRSTVRNLPPATVKDRTDVCRACDDRVGAICGRCKCFVIAKARRSEEDCENWPRIQE